MKQNLTVLAAFLGSLSVLRAAPETNTTLAAPTLAAPETNTTLAEIP